MRQALVFLMVFVSIYLMLLQALYKFVAKNRAMPEPLKYIVDEQGRKTTVLVPVELWETLNNDYGMLQKKLQILSGIQNGLKEVKEARKTGKKLQTLKDFLK
jgi:hypothetical protein